MSRMPQSYASMVGRQTHLTDYRVYVICAHDRILQRIELYCENDKTARERSLPVADVLEFLV
jgi:hypothetical protein